MHEIEPESKVLHYRGARREVVLDSVKMSSSQNDPQSRGRICRDLTQLHNVLVSVALHMKLNTYRRPEPKRPFDAIYGKLRTDMALRKDII